MRDPQLNFAPWGRKEAIGRPNKFRYPIRIFPRGLDKPIDRVYTTNMAKYEANTKVERNRLLFEYHRSHPELSLQEIGDVFEISRERVRQIILKETRRKRTQNKLAGVENHTG